MSKAEYLRAWRKKNPEKTKLHAKKSGISYHAKNKKKRNEDLRIKYHQYAMKNYFPCYYDEFIHDADISSRKITADHDYFDNRFPKPAFYWVSQRESLHTLESLKINFDYILRLQRKGLIPVFLVPHPESVYIAKKAKEVDVNAKILQTTPKDQWDKVMAEGKEKSNKLFVELLNENYENHNKKELMSSLEQL